MPEEKLKKHIALFQKENVTVEDGEDDGRKIEGRQAKGAIVYFDYAQYRLNAHHE